jgi:hypothetical protein
MSRTRVGQFVALAAMFYIRALMCADCQELPTTRATATSETSGPILPGTRPDADNLFVYLYASRDLVRGTNKGWRIDGVYDEIRARNVTIELPNGQRIACVSTWTDLFSGDARGDNRVWAVQCLRAGGPFTLKQTVEILEGDLRNWNIAPQDTLLQTLQQMKESVPHQGEAEDLPARAAAKLPPIRLYWGGGRGKTPIGAVAQLDVTLFHLGDMWGGDQYSLRIVFSANDEWIAEHVFHIAGAATRNEFATTREVWQGPGTCTTNPDDPIEKLTNPNN